MNKFTEVFSLQELVLDGVKEGHARYEHGIHALYHEKVPHFERCLQV